MSRSKHGHGERGHSERGFALLLVFVMAAAIALMLYRQMPRAAFESERDKEQLLIDRGAQYQRAIQIYFVTFKRYPSSIDDLEKTNDRRFLRRRYVDPYTGKSEWRLIHTNGLVLTDSKVQPPPNPNGDGSGSTTANSTGTGAGGGASSNSTQTTSNASSSNGTQAPAPAVNATVAARQSDRTLPNNQSYSNPTPAGGYNQALNQGAQYNPPNYNDPAQFPPISLFPNGYNATTPGQPGQPGQPGNGSPAIPNQPGFNQSLANLNQANLNQQPFNPNQPGQPALPAGLVPPAGFPPGMPSGLQQPPGLPPGLNQPGLNQPGFNQPGFNQSGLNAQPGSVPPLPGGMPINPDAGQPPQVSGQQFPGQQFQSPPVQQPPVQQPPMQPLPGQPTLGQGQFDPSNPGAPGASNAGLNIINQLLTTPRQPPAGLGMATTNNTQTVGGGIAGVASTFTGATIKSYGGRTDYSEWEFVFQLPQQTGIPQNGQAQNGQTQNGQQQGFQPFSAAPGGAGMPQGPPPGSAPPPPPGGFPSIPSLPR